MRFAREKIFTDEEAPARTRDSIICSARVVSTDGKQSLFRPIRSLRSQSAPSCVIAVTAASDASVVK